MQPNNGNFTFQDRKGTLWDTTITLFGARRVDASDYTELYEGEVSLLAPSHKLISDLLVKSSLCFAIIWTLVKEQAKALKIIDEKDFPRQEDETLEVHRKRIDNEYENEFLARIDGATLLAGKKAFWGAMEDFFHEEANVLSELKKTWTEAQEKIVRKQMDLLTLTKPQLEKLIEMEGEKVGAKLNEILGIHS